MALVETFLADDLERFINDLRGFFLHAAIGSADQRQREEIAPLEAGPFRCKHQDFFSKWRAMTIFITSVAPSVIRNERC